MKAQNSNGNSSPQRNHGLDERIGSLFQPDTLLGEDYAANFRRKIPLEPERILLLAILEDGVRAAKGGRCSRKRRSGCSTTTRCGSARLFRFARC
jgi:hypothetical protein